MKTRPTAKLASVVLSAALAGCSYVNTDTGPRNELTLSSPSGKATVSLEGGRITSWKTACGKELFFMPERPVSPGGDWSHGGTSLCWPWFGRGSSADGAIHGFARNRRFTLVRRERGDEGETVRLKMKVSAADHPEFPHDAVVTLTVSLTDRLSLVLKTENTGTRPFEITEGFQSYFAVSSYGKIVFNGVEATDFAAVDGMDRAFRRRAGDFGFTDSLAGMTFDMESSGNSGIVVWTPGTVEKANRNLAHDDCPRFIVIGPSSRAAEGAVTVAPGGSHELKYSMRMRRSDYGS